MWGFPQKKKKLNNPFYASHPDIFSFMDVLNDAQSDMAYTLKCGAMDEKKTMYDRGKKIVYG